MICEGIQTTVDTVHVGTVDLTDGFLPTYSSMHVVNLTILLPLGECLTHFRSKAYQTHKVHGTYSLPKRGDQNSTLAME